MTTIVHFDEQRGLLRVAGDEDRATSGLRRRPLSAALGARSDVVVDLSDLRFADSSLMVDLAVLARRLRQQGRVMCLIDPQPQVQRLIELMGLDRLPAVAVTA